MTAQKAAFSDRLPTIRATATRPAHNTVRTGAAAAAADQQTAQNEKPAADQTGAGFLQYNTKKQHENGHTKTLKTA